MTETICPNLITAHARVPVITNTDADRFAMSQERVHYPAILIHKNRSIGLQSTSGSKLELSSAEFSVGRAKWVSYNIPDVAVSKVQCIFKKTDEVWSLCDKSTFGTLLNKKKMEKNKQVVLKDGDTISFSNYDFIFYTKDVYVPSSKKIKVDRDTDLSHQSGRETTLKKKENVQQHKSEYGSSSSSSTVQDTEERISQKKLLKEKQVLEKKLKEMQTLLEEKDKAQEILNKKLEEKEEQRLRDLEQKDEQTKAMLDALQKEVRAKEEVVRIQLAREIQCLQQDKLKIENDIKDELSKKEGESAEKLGGLKEELQKVKNDLINVESKKQYLEKELELTTKAKEEASESCLRAKQEILENFGELMETELQCGICSELFVVATTLNCTHTFCHSCILEWKKKKKECPICRSRISSENRSLVLDNFIDRMVQNLSTELQNRRQELVESRQIQELLGPKEKPKPSQEPQRRRRRRGRNLSPNRSEDARLQDIIVISSSNSSESESEYTEESENSNESEYLSDESIVGDPDAYYGGYGHCYRCGRRGHWANGCPDY